MTKDEILQALRLTANGFAGHPVQDQLAEKLAALFATPEQRAEAEMAAAGIEAHLAAQREFSAALAVASKRRKKAD